MRQLKAFLAALLTVALFAPASADEADLARFERIITYLTTNARSEPSESELHAAALAAIETADGAPAPTVNELKSALLKADDNGEFHQKIVLSVLKSLDDRWARLYTPEKNLAMRARLAGLQKGSLGLGMVRTRSRGYVVIDVAPGSPADGHIALGDSVLSVNGIPAEKDAFGEQFRGTPGGHVTLIVSDEEGHRRTVHMKRADFDAQTAYVMNREQRIIRISNFGHETPLELKEAMDELGPGPVVIDLRFNSGGYVESAVKCADLFLDPDTRVVTVATPNETKIHDTVRGRSYNSPVCLLVNRKTASAAEIFAAAMRTHLNSLVVGETTFGKGSVQRLVTLPGNWAVKYTIALYETPDGKFIDEVGLNPDLDIKVDPGKIRGPHDDQIQAALASIAPGTKAASRGQKNFPDN